MRPRPFARCASLPHVVLLVSLSLSLFLSLSLSSPSVSTCVRPCVYISPSLPLLRGLGFVVFLSSLSLSCVVSCCRTLGYVVLWVPACLSSPCVICAPLFLSCLSPLVVVRPLSWRRLLRVVVYVFLTLWGASPKWQVHGYL